MLIDNSDIRTDTDKGLRDYQVKIKNEIFSAWKTHRSLMLQMPTGTGKTRLFSSIVKDLHNLAIELRKAIKILILVHRKELLDQVSETIGYKYNIAHGIIMSKHWQQKKMPIQIASVQTLSRRLLQWTEKKFDYIIIDEAHHATATSYNNICSSFPDAKILGVTATPYRLNGDSFNLMFEKLITSQSINEFIRQKYLSDYQYFSIRPDSLVQRSINNIDEFDINGDYSEKAMLQVIDNKYVRADILKAYKSYATGKKGIIYTINKKHNKDICEIFENEGIKAKAIDSDTNIDERAEIVNQFKSGKIDVLCNVNIFSEGFDCPDIEFIQIARPTKSMSLYLQQVGRGLRPHPNIDKVIFLDNVGSYNSFGLPSLDRNWEKYFNGAAYNKQDVLDTEAQKKVEFITEITEGNEDVELLYSGLKPDSEFDEFSLYELIIKLNGYSSFSRFGGFCGFEYNDLSRFIEQDEFEDEDGDENIRLSIFSRENTYYEKDFTIVRNLVKVRKNDLWGIYAANDNKHLLFEIVYTNIQPANGLGYAIAEKKSKKGLLNIINGSVAIPFEFDEIESLYYLEHFNLYYVERRGKYGVLDNNNNIVIPIKYDEIDIKHDIFNVRTGKSWSVFDNGIEITKGFKFIKKIGLYSKMEYKGHFGLWDYKMECLVFPFICSAIDYKYSIYKLSYESSFYTKFEWLLDSTLDIIISFKYNQIDLLSDTYYRVKREYSNDESSERGFGILDNTGIIILKPEFEQIDLLDNGFIVRKDNEWKLLDFNGKLLGVNKKKKELLK